MAVLWNDDQNAVTGDDSDLLSRFEHFLKPFASEDQCGVFSGNRRSSDSKDTILHGRTSLFSVGKCGKGQDICGKNLDEIELHGIQSDGYTQRILSTTFCPIWRSTF